MPIRPPLRKGKTVLVVDDFCTEGNSFEAARAYIQSTGAKAICLAWLKTINSDYCEIRPLPKLKPYEPNKLDKAPERVGHWFSNHIRNPSATADLQQVFKRCYKWDWPAA
jgi:hypoxanthine phosphoribosyltransferase